MSWADIKAQARDVVHATFKYDATYTRLVDSSSFAVSVRLHRDVERIGGIEDGATVSVFRDECVLLTSEVGTPARGDTIEIVGEGTFGIDYVEPPADGAVVVVVTQ